MLNYRMPINPVNEALKHASLKNRLTVNIKYIDYARYQRTKKARIY